MRKYPRGLQAMRRRRGFGFVVKELESCCEENPDCEFREQCTELYDLHCDHWDKRINERLRLSNPSANSSEPIQA
jgi:hypothetical protein